jgi:glycosyltransferase involved in cell wall biosynthesis
LIGKTLRGIPSFIDKIYIVDDCSKDRTVEIAQEFARKDPKIDCIGHERNKGVGGAIITGYKKAIKDGINIAVVMAGDDQMDPKYLPDLIDPIIDQKADFTKGNRLRRGFSKGMSPWRLFGNHLLSVLNKISSGYWNINDPVNGYVAIDLNGLKKIDLDRLDEGYAFENDMMIKANIAGIRMEEVLMPAKYSKEKSSIKYGRYIFRTSAFLLTSFLWRIWQKYLIKGNFLGLLYLIGCFGCIIGIYYSVLGDLSVLLCSSVIFLISCIWESKLPT